MSCLKRFKIGDVVHGTIVTKPDYNFIVHSGKTYINYHHEETGDFSNKINHVSQGEMSLYEMNVNRPSDSLVFQFISKDTTRYAYRTVSTSQFDDSSQFKFGDTIQQPYPLSASINRIFIDEGQLFSSIGFNGVHSYASNNKKYIRSLAAAIGHQNTLTQRAPSFDDLGTKKVNMICVPGIFYGSGVDKKSVELNFYVTGTLVAQAKDSHGDGRIVQTTGTQSGSVAGYILYNHGLILLTGAWDQSTNADKYFHPSTTSNPTWLSFGTGLKEIGTPSGAGSIAASKSYEVKFKATNKIPTLTMMAHAEKNELNYSSNPTFIQNDTAITGSITKTTFSENKTTIKNIKKSNFVGHEEDFENITYISKVGIYDEEENLIAVATLANPIKKLENRDYTIKMRLDF
tara:strand:+ start:7807 stop:9012 length:1206 start_codon:yes stop_codon:yes gene_type:complete